MNRAIESICRPAPPPALFDAVLFPHRSLTALGFWLVMGAFTAVSAVVGVAFLVTGAWPVFGFFGLDVLLLYGAFRLSYDSGRVYETLRLAEGTLTVERVTPRGRSSMWTFQPSFVRVEIDEPPEHHSQLTLSSHGRSLVIGSFLPPHERAEVAAALRSALARQTGWARR